MSPTAPIEPEQFSLESFLRPGDRVVCGQHCAEPLTLTRRLVERCTESTVEIPAYSAYLPEPGVTADIEQMALYAGRSCSLIAAPMLGGMVMEPLQSRFVVPVVYALLRQHASSAP